MKRAQILASVGLSLSLSLALAGCGEDETSAGPDAGRLRDAGQVPLDGGQDPTTPADMQPLLDLMNEARAEVNSPPLRWNSAVAATAATWAAGCSWGHAPQNERVLRGELMGENLGGGTGNRWTPEGLGQGWNDEKVFFDCASNECQPNEVCGHYTQVIWRETTEVGCALHDCTSGSPFGGGAWQYLVCRYLPAGNFVGMRPVPAADCP